MYFNYEHTDIVLLVFFIYSMYSLDVFQSTRNTLAIKYKKMQSLSTLVKTQYKNIFMIFWVCLCIIVKNAYLTLCQKLNKSVVKLGKNRYTVTYVINGIQYSMDVQVKRGPKKLLQALDSDDNDITEVIQSYLGPMENFHGHSYTPEFFGTGEITISLSSGDELVFRGDETIRLEKDPLDDASAFIKLRPTLDPPVKKDEYIVVCDGKVQGRFESETECADFVMKELKKDCFVHHEADYVIE